LPGAGGEEVTACGSDDAGIFQRGWLRGGRKHFFFEKKKQKTFTCLGKFIDDEVDARRVQWTTPVATLAGLDPAIHAVVQARRTRRYEKSSSK
jgi:hypothetical protein